MPAVTSDDQLFEVPELVGDAPDSPVTEMPKAPVDKVFRPYDLHQLWLMPPSLDEWVGEDHLARFVSELVEEVLDLEPFLASYTEVRGQPPYDPRLMVKLVVYGYLTGVRSSRAIERRCHDDVAFRFLAANSAPDFRSVARFRRRHLQALAGLFAQVLALCGKAGMVRLGRVALDGSKVRANASRHKSMSYEYMVETEARLQAEIDTMLAEAEAADQADDERLGPDGRDDDLPAELARRETRLAKIRAAMADLEAEAAAKKARAAAEREANKASRGADRTEGEPTPSAPIPDTATDAASTDGPSTEQAVPDPKSQRNFTDPSSRIMKTADGSFQQCYNAQTVVDDAHQVIVATKLTQSTADCPQLPAMLDEVGANCGTMPRQLLADAGYFSADNVDQATSRGVDPLIATGRLRHSERVAAAPRGRIPRSATPKQRMARKLRTKPGRAAYARRKAIVEPVFGQIDTCHGGKQLLLRGIEAAAAEWDLICACHNLRKLFGVTGTANFAR